MVIVNQNKASIASSDESRATTVMLEGLAAVGHGKVVGNLQISAVQGQHSGSGRAINEACSEEPRNLQFYLFYTLRKSPECSLQAIY